MTFFVNVFVVEFIVDLKRYTSCCVMYLHVITKYYISIILFTGPFIVSLWSVGETVVDQQDRPVLNNESAWVV